MSFIDPSMESMLEMFIYESTTLLEELDSIMMESEKSKNISEKNINEIFRVMHTIKGSAAMMGVESVANLAHAVEDVFAIVRTEPAKLQLIGDTIYDLLFHASDFIKVEIDSLQGADYTPSDPIEMIEQLEAQANIMTGTATAPAAVSSATDAQTPDAQAPDEQTPDDVDDMHQVRVFFEDDCQMENIRGFMLMTQLKDWCEDLESIPAHPESDSTLSAEIVRNGFIVKFRTTGSLENIYKVIESAVNVKSYEPMDGVPISVIPAVTPSEESAPTGTSGVSTTAQDPAAAVQQQIIGKPVNKQNLISVNQIKLDQLMDLVGELVTAESMVASNPDLKGLVLDNFHKSTRELRKLTDELQDVVMSIRMVPLSGVFQKMNRIVRDMGKKLGKTVDLDTIGGDTEVDKTINDIITDPFMHMIRNSMDHAIESPEERDTLGKSAVGKVTITAQNIGGEIVITVADDGRGLDIDGILRKAKSAGLLTKPEAEYTEKEIFSMIMLAGFSTNKEVTEFSGRGVGMDVVRKNIEKVGGTIGVESVKNVGTTFTIKIPLTLAIVDGMEISVGHNIFTLPITSIKQSFKIFDENQVIHNTDGAEMIMLRGECYPIIRLHRLFGIETGITNLTEGIVIQIENGTQVGCIFADELIGEQQVVVKPFPLFLKHYSIKECGLSGCTILGDGSISLILDANNLLSVYER